MTTRKYFNVVRLTLLPEDDMISREPLLLLAPDEGDSITLSQEERLAILRRLDKLEATNERLLKENGRLHRELDAVRAERERLRKELGNSEKKLGEAGKVLKDTKKELGDTKKDLEDTKAQLAHHLQGVAATDMATPSSKKLGRRAVAPAESRKKGRRPGGQPGHPPHNRPRPDHVDETKDLTLDHCPECGLKLGEEPTDTYVRFVTELIPAYLFVLQLNVHRYWCSHCDKLVQADSDQALPGRQFGPRLVSTLVLLSMMGLPVRRIQEVVLTMAGLSVSTGEVQDLLEFSAEKLGPEYARIREEVRQAYLVQPDETSMRVGGKNWWAWSFATDLAAYYELDPSRGKKVVERVLGRDFAGTVVSDGWCAYNILEGRRGVCWIHINRHLQAVEVAHGIEPRGPRDLSAPVFTRRGRPPETFLTFAQGLRALLREAVEWSEKNPVRVVAVGERQAQSYEVRVRQLCDAKSKDKDVGRISRDLLKRMPYLFTFVRDARIPWHNNAGERAIRSVCVKRKMSGGLRSKGGAEAYARLKTVHETMKRKGQDFLQAVRDALTRPFSGQPSAMHSTG